MSEADKCPTCGLENYETIMGDWLCRAGHRHRKAEDPLAQQSALAQQGQAQQWQSRPMLANQKDLETIRRELNAHGGQLQSLEAPAEDVIAMPSARAAQASGLTRDEQYAAMNAAVAICGEAIAQLGRTEEDLRRKREECIRVERALGDRNEELVRARHALADAQTEVSRLRRELGRKR